MVWAVWHWSLIVEMLKGLASCGVAGEEKPHKSLTVPSYSLKALRVKIVTHIVCQKRLHSLNSSGF